MSHAAASSIASRAAPTLTRSAAAASTPRCVTWAQWWMCVTSRASALNSSPDRPMSIAAASPSMRSTRRALLGRAARRGTRSPSFSNWGRTMARTRARGSLWTISAQTVRAEQRGETREKDDLVGGHGPWQLRAATRIMERRRQQCPVVCGKWLRSSAGSTFRAGAPASVRERPGAPGCPQGRAREASPAKRTPAAMTSSAMSRRAQGSPP